MRDAIKLAQAMLSAAGAEVTVDGIWGVKSETAWQSVSDDVREVINESVLRNESVSMTQVRYANRNRSDTKRVVNTTPRQERALVTPNITAVSKDVPRKETVLSYVGRYSGWKRAVAVAAESVGYDEKSARAIMAQVEKESSGRLLITENPRYSIAFVRRNLPRFRNYSDEEVVAMQRGDVPRFFNIAYANKTGNGDEWSGDGFKFRGRGPFQLTGRANYRRVGGYVGIDLEAYPDWVIANESNAVHSVIGFLQMSGKIGKPLTRASVAKLVNPSLVEA